VKIDIVVLCDFKWEYSINVKCWFIMTDRTELTSTFMDTVSTRFSNYICTESNTDKINLIQLL